MKSEIVAPSFPCSHDRLTVVRITIFTKLTTVKPDQKNINKYYHLSLVKLRLKQKKTLQYVDHCRFAKMFTLSSEADLGLLQHP